MSNSEDLIIRLETMYNILAARATGGSADDVEFRALRMELLEEPSVAPFLPRFLTTCRDLSQFWSHIKGKFGSYQERRDYLTEQFAPAFVKLEGRGGTPADAPVSDVLSSIDIESVHGVWTRALARRAEDPEGAITSARTLLETVCKHILDDANVEYDPAAELPKLYRAAAQILKLAPEEHQEQIFKQILGGCQTVVEGLGAVRNRLGDAHGKGRRSVKPSARHAELAVGLAGVMATFLVRTWAERKL